MGKIAVDVVLLPSEEITDRTIEVNRELLKQCPDKIVLDKEHCLPHISLAMGCIEEADVAAIGRILQDLAKSHSPGMLSIAGVEIGTNASNEKVSILLLKKTGRLQALHETVMRELAAYFSYDVSTEMVLSPPTAEPSTLLWIRNYPQNSSFEKFSPHITLGYGQIENVSFTSEFFASKLTLCHLGNHCTCRRILVSAEFDG
jgi:2'-5' RNA ligase